MFDHFKLTLFYKNETSSLPGTTSLVVPPPFAQKLHRDHELLPGHFLNIFAEDHMPTDGSGNASKTRKVDFLRHRFLCLFLNISISEEPTKIRCFRKSTFRVLDASSEPLVGQGCSANMFKTRPSNIS